MKYSTDDSAFGRDPIGKKDVAKTLNVHMSSKTNYKNNSPLSLEHKELKSDIEKLIDSMSGIKTKKIISESLKPASNIDDVIPNLLNEDNLLEEL